MQYIEYNINFLTFLVLQRVLPWYKIKGCKKEKQVRTPNMVFVVASHYQSLQIVVSVALTSMSVRYSQGTFTHIVAAIVA